MPDFERLTDNLVLYASSGNPIANAYERGVIAGKRRARIEVTCAAFLIAVVAVSSLASLAARADAVKDGDAPKLALKHAIVLMPHSEDLEFPKDKFDWLFRYSVPLRQIPRVTDSKGCLWYLDEYAGRVGATLAHGDDKKPVCRPADVSK